MRTQQILASQEPYILLLFKVDKGIARPRPTCSLWNRVLNWLEYLGFLSLGAKLVGLSHIRRHSSTEDHNDVTLSFGEISLTRLWLVPGLVRGIIIGLCYHPTFAPVYTTTSFACWRLYQNLIPGLWSFLIYPTLIESIHQTHNLNYKSSLWKRTQKYIDTKGYRCQLQRSDWICSLVNMENEQCSSD